jgi:hypothetical protein
MRNCSRLSGAAMGLLGTTPTLVAARLLTLRDLRTAPPAQPLPAAGSPLAAAVPRAWRWCVAGLLDGAPAAVGEPGAEPAWASALAALSHTGASPASASALLRQSGRNTTLGRRVAPDDSTASVDLLKRPDAASPAPACLLLPPMTGDSHRLGGGNAAAWQPPCLPLLSVRRLASTAEEASMGSGDAGPSSTLSKAAVPASSAWYMCVRLAGCAARFCRMAASMSSRRISASGGASCGRCGCECCCVSAAVKAKHHTTTRAHHNHSPAH